MGKYVYNEYDENPVFRTYKQRKKRKLKKKVKIIGFVIVLLMIIGFLCSSYSRIQSIQIVGSEKMTDEQILEHLSVNQSSVYFLINKVRIVEELKDLDHIQNATVQMNWKGDLKINIEEAIPIAYAQINQTYYEINDIGKVVTVKQKEVETLRGLPFVQNFHSIDLLKQFAEGFYKVPSLIQNEISDIILEPQNADPTRLKCLMKEEKKIYVRIEDLATRLDDSQFNYEAFKAASQDKCTFSIEGNYVYMEPCE